MFYLFSFLYCYVYASFRSFSMFMLLLWPWLLPNWWNWGLLILSSSIHGSFVVLMLFLLLSIFVTFVQLQRCHYTFLSTVVSYSIFSNISTHKQIRSHIHSHATHATHATHDTLHRPFSIIKNVLSDRTGVSGFFLFVCSFIFLFDSFFGRFRTFL